MRIRPQLRALRLGVPKKRVAPERRGSSKRTKNNQDAEREAEEMERQQEDQEKQDEMVYYRNSYL